MNSQSRVRDSKALTTCHNKPIILTVILVSNARPTTSATKVTSFLVMWRGLYEQRIQLSFLAQTFKLFLEQRH